MNWREIPIDQLIPQRPPLVLVDHVVKMEGTHCTTEFTIPKDGLFVDHGMLSPAGIIENMAQSCAARIGALNWLHHEAVKIGFIGSIRNAEIFSQPKVGDVLTTEVEITEEVFHLTLADVEVYINKEPAATSRMKIATIEKR